MLHADLPGAINAASAAAFSVGLWAAHRRRLPLLLLAGGRALGLKLAFLDRRVALHDGREMDDPPST